MSETGPGLVMRRGIRRKLPARCAPGHHGRTARQSQNTTGRNRLVRRTRRRGSSWTCTEPRAQAGSSKCRWGETRRTRNRRARRRRTQNRTLPQVKRGGIAQTKSKKEQDLAAQERADQGQTVRMNEQRRTAQAKMGRACSAFQATLLARWLGTAAPDGQTAGTAAAGTAGADERRPGRESVRDDCCKELPQTRRRDWAGGLALPAASFLRGICTTSASLYILGIA